MVFFSGGGSVLEIILKVNFSVDHKLLKSHSEQCPSKHLQKRYGSPPKTKRPVRGVWDLSQTGPSGGGGAIGATYQIKQAHFFEVISPFLAPS